MLHKFLLELEGLERKLRKLFKLLKLSLSISLSRLLLLVYPPLQLLFAILS